MAEKENWAWQPIGSPPLNVERSEENWTQFDSSVNAVSFGFVATAILISMFLVMAIFERFLRPNSPEMSPSRRRDIESQLGFHPKLGFPSPKMNVYSKEFSVLMPGEDVPTFIAQPVPLQCPPHRIQWPPPKHNSHPNATPSDNRSTNS